MQTPSQAWRVRQALERFGAPLADLSVDDLTQAWIVFQIGVEPIRVDILTSIEGLTFPSAYRRAVVGKDADVPVKIFGGGCREHPGWMQPLLSLEVPGYASPRESGWRSFRLGGRDDRG